MCFYNDILQMFELIDDPSEESRDTICSLFVLTKEENIEARNE